MTPLGKLLVARINQTGPMRLSDYMAECLLHPEHGYYTTRDPLGAAGDFTTAPEISQMFGELIGLALAQAWLDQGAPAPFTLAELGPGRGTLMVDILRATKAVPGFHAGMELWFVEASPVLCAAQEQALTGFEPNWAEDVSTLPDAPLFLVANEFFDALPIRQFVRDDNGWRERMVGVTDGVLSFGLGPEVSLPARLSDTTIGDVVEVNSQATAIMASIAARVNSLGGAALVVDYGGWHSLGDTFQALQNHQITDPLAAPGQADLTAHVDFEALTLAAPALTAAPLTSQGVFLERLGIADRAQVLAGRLSGEKLDSHIAAHRRLTHPDEMGTLFQVLGLTCAGAPPIPGT